MRRDMTALLIWLFAFAPVGGHAQRAEWPADALSAAGNVLTVAAENGTAGGALGLIARGDEVLLLHAVGEIGPGQPMPINAIVRLASITKAVTATAVLILAERGEIQLDARVEDWLPGFGRRILAPDGDTVAAERGVTIMDLLTHRAGLIAGGAELERLWDVSTAREFATRIGAIPLRFQPGSRFEYGCCGAAYEVLAAIVEQISGESFKDFLAVHVFEPLGMTDTYFSVPESKRHRLSAHYGRDSAGRLTLVRARGEEEVESAFYSGGGGMRSTVLDYHRFALMLLNGGELDGVRVLQPESVQMMRTNQVGDQYPGDGFGWGFGVRVRTTTTTDDGSGLGSFGWVGGTGTAFEVDPNSRMIAIVFVPTWPGTPGVSDLRNRFMAAATAASGR